MKTRERGREIEGAVSFKICAVMPSGPGEVSLGKLVMRRETSSAVQSRSGEKGRGGGGDGLEGNGGVAWLKQEEKKS